MTQPMPLSFLLFLWLVLPCSAFLNTPKAVCRNPGSWLGWMESSDEQGVVEVAGKKNGTLTTTSTGSISNSVRQALSLQEQAQKLRDEALVMRQNIEDSKEQQLAEENAKIDKWIDDLLIQCQVNENTEMLNSVDQVMELLRDQRFSQEQVNKIFNRICETGPAQSRSHCSPLMTLFVDAVGKLDCIDRQDNPNKRWSGRVERVLRKRLFAMDWGMDLDEEEDAGNSGLLK